METIIHNVNKINVSPVRKLVDNTFVRDVLISSEIRIGEIKSGEMLKIICFGEEKDLQIEIEKTEKI